MKPSERSQNWKMPGVASIRVYTVDELPDNIVLLVRLGLPVALNAGGQEVDFFGEPDYTCTFSRQNGKMMATCTLKFTTLQRLPAGRLAFKVTDVDGCQSLLMATSHPFPIVVREATVGAPSGAPAAITYTVTHTQPCEPSITTVN